MTDGADGLRYKAFLSYSHRDEAITRRLHRRLESYRSPRSLGGVRLQPVFRDRDELASAGTLSLAIERALDESAALVVVCSPAAVRSPWVGAEIRHFRRRHPDRPVFAFVVDGDPGADPRHDGDRAALPLALLLLDPGQPEGALGEPLAADARAGADGFGNAFLKLAAGLLGVRYDDLRHRHQRRRQQRLVAFGAAASLLAMTFAWLAWDATRARDAARAAQARAELELRSERQTREFLLSVFHLADATEARGQQVTVREVLDRAVARIDHSEFDRPALRGRYLATMGQAYSSLGLLHRGTELLQQAVDGLVTAADPESREQRANSRIELAEALFDMGDYDRALAVLDGFTRDEPDSGPMQRARVDGIRGDVLTYLERDDEAAAAYRRVLAAVPEGTGDRDAIIVRAQGLTGLAGLALFQDDAAAAMRGFTDAVAVLRDALGEDHPRTIAARISLGSAAYRAAARDVASREWAAALADAARVYDIDSPLIGTTKNNLGLLMLEDGRLDQAEPLLRAALESDRRHRSVDFDDLCYPLHNLGYLLLATGRYDEARPLLAEGVRLADDTLHRMRPALLAALADLECSSGDPGSGSALARRAIAALAEQPEPDAWRHAQARLVEAFCRQQAGEPQPAAAFANDRDTVLARWPVAANPFARRAILHWQALASAGQPAGHRNEVSPD